MNTKAFVLPIVFCALLGASFTAIAQGTPPTNQQNISNQGVLEVQGQGRMRVQPDQAMVMIQVQNTNTEAGRAVQVVTERVEQLLKKLQEAGFKKDEIKTSQFFLHENNQWVNDRMVRNGYTATQTLEIRFPLDQQRMTKLTNVFAGTQEGVTFNFSFGLSDKLRQQVKEELIRKALQDAREKASVIARSANIRLGSIRRIDYGNQGNMPSYYKQDRAVNQAMAMEESAGFPQTAIQDIEMTDQILITWSLEQ